METKTLLALSFLPLILFAASGPAFSEPALSWKPGPYPLFDDHFLAATENVDRKIHPPQRLPEPIITGAKEDGSGDNCFQPYFTVLRSPETGRFGMWYGVPENANQSHLAYIESEDGIKWTRPHRVLEDPAKIQFGCAVVDRGPDCPEPDDRFVYGFYGEKDGKGGLRIAYSPDGIRWRITDALLAHNHDINWLGWDPIRKRFLAFVSFMVEEPGWGEARRIPHMSVSENLRDWREPWRIIEPEQGEGGETQFYCMAGAIARGETLIALLKVLRDDLNPEPDKTAQEMGENSRKAAGLGYTVLAWSYDGETWKRDVEPFLDRNPLPDAWDRAMTWGDCQLPVGDEIFIYLGGYRRGHKINRFQERQIGLARMMRDRYVSRSAGAKEGMIRTRARLLEANRLTVNSKGYDALKGRLLNADGEPIPGFDFDDLQPPIEGDSVRHPVRWKEDLSSWRGKAVALELRFVNTEVFAFDWAD